MPKTMGLWCWRQFDLQFLKLGSREFGIITVVRHTAEDLGFGPAGSLRSASDFTVPKPAAFGIISWNAQSRYAATVERKIRIYAFVKRFENEKRHTKNSIALLSGSLVLLCSYALMFASFGRRSRAA